MQHVDLETRQFTRDEVLKMLEAGILGEDEPLLLVVEIARTSQRIDREKAVIYARGGAQAYWLLDLAARRLEDHVDPTPDGTYAVVRVLDERATVVPPNCEASCTVGDLLP